MPPETSPTDIPNMPEGTALGIRFANDDSGLASASIYDLGLSLLAVQRIVHKADLARNNRLRWGAKPSTDKRRELALTVSGRVEGSDIWGLTPLLTDPRVAQYLRALVGDALKALASYVGGKIVEQFSQDVRKSGPSLASGIYREVADRANRVGAAGGAAEVEMFGVAPDGTVSVARIKFDAKTRDYVNEAEAERVLGPQQDLKGVVSRLYPNQNKVHIISEKRYVHVTMDEPIFSKVRYESAEGDRVTFRGFPVYRLGSSIEAFREFEALEVNVQGRTLE